jgi:membrane protease YdiL (CAAX protease family)
VGSTLDPAAAPLLWETFLLYFALIAVEIGLRDVLPRAPQAGSVAGAAGGMITQLLLMDLLGLLPLLYLAFHLRRRGQTLAEIGLSARTIAVEVGYGVGGYAAVLPWLILVAMLTEWAGRRFFPEIAPPFHPVQALTAAAPSGWARLGLFLLVAVGAPLWEEIFFRGVLYGALRRRFGVAAGCVASATLFSLLHPQLPLGFLPIFFLGAMLALLYEWRRSLVPGMVLHALNNGLIFLFLILLFPPAS